MILASIGTALSRGQVRGIFAVLLLYAGFLLKSRIEEHFMIETFGHEYDVYRQTTGAILPRLRY